MVPSEATSSAEAFTMRAENPAGQTIRTGSSRAQEQYPATPLGTGVPVIIEGLPPSSGVIDE